MRCFLATLLLLVAVSVPADACGPFLPYPFLEEAEGHLTDAPVGSFRLEMARIAGHSTSPYRAVIPDRTPFESTARADSVDLRHVLEQLGTEKLMAELTLHQYGEVRAALAAHGEALDGWQADTADAWINPKPVKPVLLAVQVPANLPPEFDAYMRGAVAYFSGEMPSARAHWGGVLRLPAKDRHYRSTWAAFMLGKSWLIEDPARAVKWFRRVRELKDQGFGDDLGLAAESFGWEGRAELNRDRHAVAIERYLDQYATGDPGATASLHRAAAALLGSDRATLARVAANRPVQRVATAYLISERWPDDTDAEVQWLAAVERAGVGKAADLDRLAVAAYARGDFDMARRWVDRAGASWPLGQWVLAKLLLREGNVAQAADVLSGVARVFPADEAWRALREDPWTDYDPLADLPHGELGVLMLARQQYAEALDVLLRGGYWLDGAYVAERVLTVDELKAYVDRCWSPGRPAAEDSMGTWRSWSLAEARVKIRHLLARRLTRLGRYDEAGPYFPIRWRERVLVLAAAMEKSEDARRDAVGRGAALFEAARETRYCGMELLGTELEPDWAVFGGQFDEGESSTDRARSGGDGPVGASSDERARLVRHAKEIAFNERFHYRRVAADMAWRAAEMMPDNTDLKAGVLCEGGTWLKNRDPELADRFYKALVRTCGATALGREAERMRWFPNVRETDE